MNNYDIEPHTDPEHLDFLDILRAKADLLSQWSWTPSTRTLDWDCPISGKCFLEPLALGLSAEPYCCTVHTLSCFLPNTVASLPM